MTVQTMAGQKMTVQEIADLLQADVEGDGGLEVTACNAVELATASEIAFVEGDKAEAAAAASHAGCLLLAPGVGRPADATVIRVAQARNAFARVLRALHPPVRADAGVDPTAVVADSVQLGEGVSVGPHGVLEDGVRVGANTVIAAGVTIGRGSSLGQDCQVNAGVSIYHGVTAGDRVILHSGCVLGADGFGYAFEGDHYEKFPQIGTVEIGNDVEIGANACVDRGALGATVIGDGSKLDNLVHIGHNCRLGKHVVLAAQVGLSGGVIVDDYVVMGGQAGIGEKAHIGAKAVVGGQCGILPFREVPPGETLWGTPSRPLREHLRKLAMVNRLPKIIAELKELRKAAETGEGK